MIRFVLDGPQPSTIFCFAPYTMHELRNRNRFLLVSFSVSCKHSLCFVHGQGSKGEHKHRRKNFVGFQNHSPLIAMHG